MISLNVGCGGRPKDRASFQGDVRIDVRHFPAVNFIGDVEELPFRPKSFDRIYCFEVLEHLVAPLVALTEMSKVLADNGEIDITIPNVWFWHKIYRWITGKHYPYDMPDHKQVWDLYEFERLIYLTDLAIEAVQFLNWYPRHRTYWIERLLPDCLSHTHTAIKLRKKDCGEVLYE